MTRQSKDDDAAYLAGLIDSDGSLELNYQAGRPAVRLRLAVRATPASLHLLEVMATRHGGTLQTLDRSPYQPLQLWSLSGVNLMQLLPCLRPHLRLKASKADALTLAYNARRQGWRPTPAELRSIVADCSTERGEPLPLERLHRLRARLAPWTSFTQSTNSPNLIPYLSGFVDGDGSVGFHSNGRGGRRPMVTTSQRCSPSWSALVEETTAMFGGGETRQPHGRPGTARWSVEQSAHSRWRRDGREALPVLRAALPHLQLKRAEVELVLRLAGLWWFGLASPELVKKGVELVRAVRVDQPIAAPVVPWLPSLATVEKLLDDANWRENRRCLVRTATPSHPRLPRRASEGLTETEQRIVATLRPPGRTVAYADLCQALWGRSNDRRARGLLRRHVCNIHRKRPELTIKAVRGIGLRLEP